MLSEPSLDEPRDCLEGTLNSCRPGIALVILAHTVDDDAPDVDPERFRVSQSPFKLGVSRQPSR
jgi:hypothetical protein